MAKKTELALVNAKDLQVIEYRGQRVVTTEQLAAGYGATEQMITNNFNRNKTRFVEGKHFFKLAGDEVDILLEVYKFPRRLAPLRFGLSVVPPITRRCWKPIRRGITSMT